MEVYLVYKQFGEPYVIAAFSMEHTAKEFADRNNCRHTSSIRVDRELDEHPTEGETP